MAKATLAPSPGVEHEANELRLYITTSSEPMYRRHMAIEAMLDAHETLTAEFVHSTFRLLANEAARAYVREYGIRFGCTFPIASRTRCAEELATVFMNGLRRDGTIKARLVP